MAEQPAIAQENEDFSLSPHPDNCPSAGDVRKHGTSQSLFISPLPLPTGALAEDDGSFLEVNETYLDVGLSSKGKAFQVQLCTSGMTFIALVMLAILAFIYSVEIDRPPSAKEIELLRMNAMAFGDPEAPLIIPDKDPRALVLDILFHPGLFFLVGFFILSGICIHSILSTTFDKARQRPIRFHRQRREVCLFIENSDRPIICPWEDVVAWVSTSTGSTGANVMQTHTFGMAIEDKQADKYWFLTEGVLMPSVGLMKWEAIRAYMELGVDYCPPKADYEGLHTFKANREAMTMAFNISPKYWFKIPMLDFSQSYLGLGLNFIYNVLCWWKFPYWVAEWDHKQTMQSMPNTINDWSKPLPESEWAKPSALSVKHTKALTQYLNEGGEFMDYCKDKLQPDLHAAMAAHNEKAAQNDNATQKDKIA